MDEQQRNELASQGLHVEAHHEWALDVVCGMEVEPTSTNFCTKYATETYYFCNNNCMNQFINDPKKYVG